jgi:hypothetical protein
LLFQLVSRAKQICQIGYHAIYKVEDVSMIYVPASGAPSQPDELKYAKLFQVFSSRSFLRLQIFV